MLSRIPLDVINYVITPYIRVSAAVIITTYTHIKLSTLDRAVYWHPHGMIVNDRDTSYYHNGKLHRIDGPAIHCPFNNLLWWRAGELHHMHCSKDPCSNSYTAWYQHGKRHRIDGPAVVYGELIKFWFNDGVEYNNSSQHNYSGGGISIFM